MASAITARRILGPEGTRLIWSTVQPVTAQRALKAALKATFSQMADQTAESARVGRPARLKRATTWVSMLVVYGVCVLLLELDVGLGGLAAVFMRIFPAPCELTLAGPRKSAGMVV